MAVVDEEVTVRVDEEMAAVDEEVTVRVDVVDEEMDAVDEEERNWRFWVSLEACLFQCRIKHLLCARAGFFLALRVGK